MLRDHGIEPIAMFGNQVVCMRIAEKRTGDTDLRPLVYDFFRASTAVAGSRLILRGCSQKLVWAIEQGLTHFLYEDNPLVGRKLWSSYDNAFAIYDSRGTSGHVFYRRLRRGAVPDIPVVLVVSKEYAEIGKLVRRDRDRNAFGEALMKTFSRLFARSGLMRDSHGQRVIDEAGRVCWAHGHPLLNAIADASWVRPWPPAIAQAVFGTEYFARCITHDPTQQIQFDGIEQAWKAAGRTCLPASFTRFGVPDGRRHCENLRAVAMAEARRQHHTV